MKLTVEDKKLLQSMGIDPETRDADKFLVLARRIAKHPAPAQVKLSSQAAKLQLVKLALQKLLDAEKESE